MLIKDHTKIIDKEDFYFNNCHASTVLPLEDRVLVAYFGGEREGTGDMAIWISVKIGETWEKPVRVAFEDGLAHWNPVLHEEDGTIFLFYKVGNSVHDWITKIKVSEDGGKTWAPEKELVEGDHLPRGPVKNKLIKLSNGNWAAPSSIENEKYWDSFIDISSDKGKIWKKSDIPFDHIQEGTKDNNSIWDGLSQNALWENDLDKVFKWDGIIQPTLWESEDGVLHAFMRSTRNTIYRSDSKDYGRSWCKAYATDIPNNNSGIDLVKGDNELYLVYNPIADNWGKRTPISLACSKDNGLNWIRLKDFETEDGEFSYPAIVYKEKTLYVTYTWNRKNIKYVEISL